MSSPVDLYARTKNSVLFRNIASRPATETISRSSSVETPDPEDLKEDFLRQEKEARDALTLDGGRPSHPIDSGFDIVKEPGQYAEIISYWSRGGSGWSMFRDQFGIWKEFREYQERVRQSRTDPERFAKYAQYVRDYRCEKGLEGDVELHQDRKKQSRLDDWKEYQFYQLRTADRITRDMRYAEAELELARKRLHAAVEAGQSAQSIDWIKEWGVAYWQGRRGGAGMDLEEHNVLLKWIDQQLPTIASECGSLSQGSKPFHRSDSTEARTVSEGPQLGSEAAEHSSHQPDPVRTSMKRKRSMEESALCPSIPPKVKRSNAATNVCEGMKFSNITSAPVSPDIHADNRDRDHSAAPQQQNHAAPPRRSQRIAKLRKEAPALPSASLLQVQKVSLRKNRCAARPSTKRSPLRVAKATDRSLLARDLRKRRGERGRPISLAFELDLKSKTLPSDVDLRRSKRIQERCRKDLTSAQEPPC